MRVKHVLAVQGICPVNGERDSYHVEITITQADRLEPVAVESILDLISQLTAEPIFQEALTARMAARIRGGVQGRTVAVRTLGYHGPRDCRVETDCVAEV